MVILPTTAVGPTVAIPRDTDKAAQATNGAQRVRDNGNRPPIHRTFM